MKRKEAIKWIDNRMCWGRGTFTANHLPNIDECWEAGRMAIEALSDRPHGEWILECDSEGEGDNLYRCSECGCKYGCQEYDKPNFCPSCGVDMRQEK